MAENLRVIHYRNGEFVPEVKDTAMWMNLTSGAYCNYNNTTSLDTIATYGRLYNWYAAADSRNLAPNGWHVASPIDWNTLIDYLGGDSIASNKMKEVGNSHWENPYESDNSSGFTALPAGWRQQSKNYNNIGYYCVWWTSFDNNISTAPFLYLFFVSSNVNRGFNYKYNGYSIRCIKD
jgi:uncharacterized protein (TIGR02145 family)